MSDPIAILSLIMSVFMAVATIYKYVYHVGIRADRQEMRNVPLDKSVSVKIMFTNKEFTILEAKLSPHSRKIVIPTAEQLRNHDLKIAATTDGAEAVSNPINPGMVTPTAPSMQQSDSAAGSGKFASTPEASPVSSSMNDIEQQQGAVASVGATAPQSPTSASVTTPVSAVSSVSPRSASPVPTTTDCPPELQCPLTKRLMTDPVICSDGYTYERSAIEQHFQSQRELLAQLNLPTAVTSPITKEKLDTDQLYPNRAVQALLAKHN